MHNLPPCPIRTLENTYRDGDNYACPDCAHEWPAQASTDDSEAGSDVIKDANGNPLVDGDAVILIKDLKVKGSSTVLKKGTKVTSIRLVDGDRVVKRIREDIVPKVAANAAYQHARENTPHTARMAHDQALGKAMQILLKEDTQIYKFFVENESFRRSVGDMVYAMTNT